MKDRQQEETQRRKTRSMDGDVQEAMEATRRGTKKEVETMNDGGNEREVPGKGSTKTSSFAFFPSVLLSLSAHL